MADLKEALAVMKSRNTELGAALEKERVQVMSLKTSLEAERIQTKALELELANTKKYQDALESELQRDKQDNSRLLENIEDLRRQLSANKQEKADLKLQLERERISLSILESVLETGEVLQGVALERDRETIEELSVALRDEKARAERADQLNKELQSALNTERNRFAEQSKSLEDLKKCIADFGASLKGTGVYALQAPANTYAPQSTTGRPSNSTNVVPTLDLHQPSGGTMYTDRYSPRSDRRTLTSLSFHRSYVTASSRSPGTSSIDYERTLPYATCTPSYRGERAASPDGFRHGDRPLTPSELFSSHGD